jgi:uncharacterized membrane protein YkgB
VKAAGPQSAESIAPYISNSPFVSWLSIFGIRGEAYLLGSIELHGPHDQGDQSSRSQIFGNRHDCPRLISMSEILLAIVPIPRREPGNFFTPMRNFLDRPRCSG